MAHLVHAEEVGDDVRNLGFLDLDLDLCATDGSRRIGVHNVHLEPKTNRKNTKHLERLFKRMIQQHAGATKRTAGTHGIQPAPHRTTACRVSA